MKGLLSAVTEDDLGEGGVRSPVVMKLGPRRCGAAQGDGL